MSAVRDAIVLPLLFLTVFLLAGIRLGAGVVLVPPSVFALVLGTMLLGALVRSGALAAEALLHGSRSMIGNVNGALVLATLLGAAAQVFAMLTPRSGLPLFFVDVFLFVLLLNTLVAQPDRARLLRSLAVIFGSTLVLNHVLLAGLSDPLGGQTRRILVALFDAATFGSVAQEPQSPGAGYLAFFTAGLFLVGVAALPRVRRISRDTALELASPR